MLTHLDNLGPIIMADPVNRHHPFNRGRVAWWIAPQQVTGGAFLYDLMGLNHGALTGFSSGTGWSSLLAPGSFTPLVFSGGQAVIIPSSPSLVAQANITVAAWVRMTGTGQIISKDNTTARPWALSINPTGTGRFFVSNTSNSLVVADTTAVLPTGGMWAHIVGVYDGAHIMVYVNGMLAGTPTAQTGSISTGTSSVQIGNREYAGSPDYFHGAIADPAIWNRALSASEIAELYNMGRSDYLGMLNRWQQRVPEPTAGAVINALVGTLATTSSLSALLSVSDILVGLLSTLSAETGSLTDNAYLAGTTAQTSALSGSVGSSATPAGGLSALSTMSGNLLLTIPLTGALGDTLSLTAALTNNPPGGNPLVGTLADTFSMTGSITVSAVMAAALGDTSALTGSLTVTNPGANALVGTLSILTGMTGSLSSKAPLSGGLGDTSAFTGNITVSGGGNGQGGAVNLTGSVNVTVTMTGSLVIGSAIPTLVLFTDGGSGRISFVSGSNGRV
jgi:hypothetical protein